MTIPDPLQTLRDEAMLLRAGVITPEDRDDFRDHPQAWRHEIASCRKLEDAMTLASVDPAVGWTMTVAEMAQATIKAIRAGLGRPDPARAVNPMHSVNCGVRGGDHCNCAVRHGI